MNKRHLLSSVLIAVFVGWSAAPARAVDLTLDLTQAAHAVYEIAQLKEALYQLYCQLQTQKQMLASIAHVNPDSATIALGLAAPQMQLPGSASGLLPGMVGGSAPLTQMGQAFFNSPTGNYYTPPGTDFAAQEMNRQMQASANLQGEMQMGLTQMAARMTSLNALQASIATQPDIAAQAAVQSQIASEKLYIANESNRIAYLQAMASQQNQIDRLRGEQYGRQQEEQWGAQASRLAGWGQ